MLFLDAYNCLPLISKVIINPANEQVIYYDVSLLDLTREVVLTKWAVGKGNISLTFSCVANDCMWPQYSTLVYSGQHQTLLLVKARPVCNSDLLKCRNSLLKQEI